MEDAKIAGEILIRACKDKAIRPEEWFEELRKYPYNGKIYKSEKEALNNLEPNSGGDFYGENLVFTGSLRVPRMEAAQLACDSGFSIQGSVNKQTTFLVVGQ